MNILALDTSTSRATVAIGPSTGEALVATTDPAIRHGRALVPAIRDLLAASGMTTRDLDAIAVGLGPGSFTGSRIGLTAAKVLAYTGRIPLVGLDSLEVLAHGAPIDALRVEVLVDAQRNDGFVASFARNVHGDALRRLSPTRLEPWLVRFDLPPGACVVTAEPLRSRLDWPPGIVLAPAEAAYPDGHALLTVARAAIASGRRDDPYFLEPAYLRRSAAEEKQARR